MTGLYWSYIQPNKRNHPCNWSYIHIPAIVIDIILKGGLTLTLDFNTKRQWSYNFSH